MANTPWSERSGAERRRTLGRFALLYAGIALIGLALGWIIVAAIFGLGAAALGIGWYATDQTSDSPAEATREREKPDWMKAMDDPNAPDLSLPEYRGTPKRSTEEEPRSPFARPATAGDPDPLRDPPAEPPFREA